MHELLPTIQSPADLRPLSDADLEKLAREIREELCQPLLSRSVHFASNLGVVELCLVLHQVFDFSQDRLIWDTGHQIYPHKLVTGRYSQFSSIRTKGGLMGFPNPAESPYDLFMTGHAGCSVSCALGLRTGDEMMGRAAKSVAVIGDGAFPSGIVYEAMNNAGGLDKDLVVILNDNQMSICPRVGGVAKNLDRARLSTGFHDTKKQIDEFLRKIPLIGSSADRVWSAFKDVVKSYFFGGMLFEELGFHYIGPIDGHDIPLLRDYLIRAREHHGPILLHVLTEKGHGIEPAAQDPVLYHTPPVFESVENGTISLKKIPSTAFTNVISQAIYDQIANHANISVITAAMCQGNKLEKVRDDFPDKFFDTGICEEHSVAFAAGLAKAGVRPIVAIYSTFLQRAYDQIFQEVALQNLPVTFCLDRAGFTGPDGPTHHGAFDIAYMRIFPNMVVMAPGDELDVAPMLAFALAHDGPVSMRYPKAAPGRFDRSVAPIELGQSEVIEWGTDGCIVAFGAMLNEAMRAAKILREKGYDVGVVNARFVKPLDRVTLRKVLTEMPWVLTVEEGCLEAGFGSAVLELANSERLETSHIARLGIPDRWILHAERSEQLAEAGIDVEGIVGTAFGLIKRFEVVASRSAVAADSSKRVG